MNKRIKELVGQAKFMAEETINKQISKNAELDAFAENLAELIVKECDRYVAEQYDESEPWMQPGDLLKHFGIKK